MSFSNFLLDARLREETYLVASLTLCDVLLMDDARFPWLILVPRKNNATEVSDLTRKDQQMLWREVQSAAASLYEIASFEKLNIGALGNVVRQLHVHVVGRKQGDAAWPGPVWGYANAEKYSPSVSEHHLRSLRQSLQSTTSRNL